MDTNSIDYRSMLSEALKKRQLRNPDYSLRAFARDLEVSPQKLSQVLLGKTGLSSAAAKKLVSKLNLKPLESEMFIAMVEFRHSRSQEVKRVALEKIERIERSLGFKDISPNEFGLVSHWFYMAAFMLVEVQDFQADYDWIAKRLGIPRESAERAYEQLFEMGLLVVGDDGKWKRSSTNISVSSNDPSTALRNYYRQLWSVADKTLDREPVQKREFAASVVSVSEGDVEYVRDELDAFRKKLINGLSTRPGAAERIYAMTFQFFPVDRKGSTP